MSGTGDQTLQGTGRHLTTTELRAWTRFLDASRRLEQVIAKQLVDDHNMSHSEYEILVRLDGAGGSMRLTMLADQCVSSKSRLTHTLNRVEARGWIERVPAIDDRRGVRAVITPTGSAMLAEAAVGHAALVRQHLLDPLSADEIIALGNMMDRVSLGLRESGG